MEFNMLNRKLRVSLFTLLMFLFFLLVSVVSLNVAREKILGNSHIMGQEIAARFAIRETTKIKTQEIMLRSVAQSMGQMLMFKYTWTDEEIEQALERFTEYMEKNTDASHFDLCAVIDGRLIGSSRQVPAERVGQLKWYQAALDKKGAVAYTNVYERHRDRERVLTMAVALGRGNDVLAINLYPQRLNSLLEDNRLPSHSYYYLCDPNGVIMFAINDRAMSIESQQPYVDHIFTELHKNQNNDTFYIVDYDGNKRGVYYTISEKGWISIVTIPYDYLLGEYHNLMLWFTLMLGLFLLIVILLAMRENILNKRIRSFDEVIQVMSKSYLAVYRVNFATGRFQMVKADAVNYKPVPEGYYDSLLSQIVDYVEPAAAKEFAETFSAKNFRKLAAEGITDFGGEFRHRFGNEYKWVNVRFLRDEMLKQNEAILCFREVDAEKLKELERLELTEHALRAARETAKSRNMFFSAMSHDMRAPLNGIIGMAELAELHQGDRSLLKDYLGKIKSSGRQLMTLINDILEMARLDNGKIEHLSEDFSLRETVNEIGGIYAAQAELEDKYYEQQILIGPEVVNGDLRSLRQILNNILSNAMKYTNAKGRVTFIVRPEQSKDKKHLQYTFIVQDTGCGMSEKFLEKLYTPFARDTRFGVPKVVGTGLGMAIVKSLVDRLEGTIHVTSEVDRGTSVIISLPFLKGTGEKAREDNQPKLSDFAGTKILVAEDNDINMEIITELLKMNGLEVVQARNGSEAVAAFAASDEGSIAMVLMDMEMPQLDGCGAAKAIRALERSDAAKVPIMALTGNSAPEALEKAMQAGMNDYLVKPVGMKLLARKLYEYKHDEA